MQDRRCWRLGAFSQISSPMYMAALLRLRDIHSLQQNRNSSSYENFALKSNVTVIQPKRRNMMGDSRYKTNKNMG